MLLRLIIIVTFVSLSLLGCQRQPNSPELLQEQEISVVLSNNAEGTLEMVNIDTGGKNVTILNRWPLFYPVQSLPAEELSILEHNYCPTDSNKCLGVQLENNIANLSYSSNKKYLSWIEDISWCPSTQCYGFDRVVVKNLVTGLDQVLVEIPDHIDLMTTQGISSIKWSPDGERIAFVLSTDIGSRIQIVDIITGNISDIAEGSSPIAWSPDGRQIAYAFYSPTTSWEVKVLPINSKTTNILGGNWDVIEGIDWSPDGSRMAITARERQSVEVSRYDLFIAGINGEQVKKLTSDDRLSYIKPQWSPDGTLVGTVAYSAQTQDEGNLLLFDFIKGTIKTEFNIGHGDTKWLWSRTNKTILFMVVASQSQKIGLLNLANNQAEYIHFPSQLESELNNGNINLEDLAW